MTHSFDDEPPVERHNLIHHVLVGLNALSAVPSWVFALAIAACGLAAALAAYWLEPSLRFYAGTGGVFWVAICADALLLAALPRVRLSFGPVKPPLAALVPVRLAATLLPALLVRSGMAPGACVALEALVNAALFAVIVYGTVVEPFRLGVSHIELSSPKLKPGSRLRLVQISDLHVERMTRREMDLIEQVNRLDADFILLTGDYLNFSYTGDSRAIEDARRVIKALKCRERVFAVRGTHHVDPNALLPVLFDGLPVRWLRNGCETFARNGWRVAFAGASCSLRREYDLPALSKALGDLPESTFNVLLFHTPDYVPEARSGNVDLYLAGHTHGGQWRVPVYGALLTGGTRAGKRFEMGRYDVDGLTLYVSRGIGMEGKAAPRARIFCPPELVCIDVIGAG